LTDGGTPDQASHDRGNARFKAEEWQTATTAFSLKRVYVFGLKSSVSEGKSARFTFSRGWAHLANISVIADKVVPNTGSSLSVASTGTLSVASQSASFSQTLSTGQWALGTSITGLILGKEGNTAGITVGSVTTVNGPINLYGGAIAVDAALTASDGAATPVLSNINLYASGDVTQTAGITAAGLGLHGAGNFMLAAKRRYVKQQWRYSGRGLRPNRW
jgi:hypothetical protein